MIPVRGFIFFFDHHNAVSLVCACAFFCGACIMLPLAFYFLPSILAAALDVKSFRAIFLLNILAGWTGAMWLACVFWAVIDDADIKTTIL